jgi:hypothetical protein
MQALVHHMLSGKKNFCITPKTKFSNQEQRIVFDLMMPEDQVNDMISKLILPTTYSLSNIFRVPQWFVRKRLDLMHTKRQVADHDY